MQVIDDKNEMTLGASILDKIRNVILRFLGLAEVEKRFEEYGSLQVQLSDAQVKLASQLGMEKRRLRAHERNVESLRYSAERYESQLKQQGNSLGATVAGQVREEKKILLLNQPGKIA